jgi:hypothetical protein
MQFDRPAGSFRINTLPAADLRFDPFIDPLDPETIGAEEGFPLTGDLNAAGTDALRVESHYDIDTREGTHVTPAPKPPEKKPDEGDGPPPPLHPRHRLRMPRR